MSPKIKNIITIFFLIISPLIGVILMWFLTSWNKALKIFLSLLLLIIPVSFTLFYLFIAQPHQVAGASMEPTMKNGQYFMGAKFSRANLKRDDIVVYKNPQNPDVDKVGRIVGLPGEEFKISSGKVLINGSELMEPYLLQGTITSGGSFLAADQPIKIPRDSFIMLGDNRGRSMDSREIGFVNRKDIIDKYWFTYFSP